MTKPAQSLLSTLLIATALTPQLANAAFVEYTGSGTINGHDIAMTLQIDNAFHAWQDTTHTPEYYESIGAHPSNIPFGAFVIGDYSITQEGVGTTTNTGGEIVMYWSIVGDHSRFWNDETIIDTDENFSGEFAHNHVAFLDGNGSDYDWSGWVTGDYQLAPELAFTHLNLLGWGESANIYAQDDLDLHLHAVPLPAAAWLFVPGLLGLFGFARNKSQSQPTS